MLKSTFNRPSSFQDVLDFMGNRDHVKIAHNTYLVRLPNGTFNLIYHNTAILNYSKVEVTYNSGDYQTVTTKRRFNQFAPMGVYQHNFEWFFANGTSFEDYLASDYAGENIT